MDSPLPMLQAHAHECFDVEVPKNTDLKGFDFFFPFPVGPTYKRADSHILRADIVWAPEEDCVYLQISVQDMAAKFLGDPDPDVYLEMIQPEVLAFLNSTLTFNDDGDESDIPEGLLFARPVKRNIVRPTFSTVLNWARKEDADELLSRFNLHLVYASSALWLVQPILALAKTLKRPPNKAERLRELLLAHGRSQVMRNEPDNAFNAKIFFPEGYYGSLWKAISALRPQ